MSPYVVQRGALTMMKFAARRPLFISSVHTETPWQSELHAREQADCLALLLAAGGRPGQADFSDAGHDADCLTSSGNCFRFFHRIMTDGLPGVIAPGIVCSDKASLFNH
ncbi:MAG: hypothetical protein CVU61_16260 [Deltaproteobacteria bacterium HGW-Deltaproteobacteria-19]|nr:MAG: hypothetical protein CVU61_16260 [Deltaproteobacteria bacterium HGW-Deltaproteobacteria-19]